MKALKMTLNGKIVEIAIDPDETLLHVLRKRLGLLGTKEGCGQGDCGVCTVLLDGEPVNSCIMPAFKAMGKKVTTIEGLSQGSKLHPLQKAFVDCGAIQCGFCTPGMILSSKALLDKNPNPIRGEVQEAISGNLCRCGGYEMIIDAIMSQRNGMRGAEHE